MIKKLFNLKKLQADQHISQKQQLNAKIFDLNTKIEEFQNQINTTGVSEIGAIRDFYMLELHRKNLRQQIRNFEIEVIGLKNEVVKEDKIIIELTKEKEQFKYILELEKNKKIANEIKRFEEESSELIQFRHIHG